MPQSFQTPNQDEDETARSPFQARTLNRNPPAYCAQSAHSLQQVGTPGGESGTPQTSSVVSALMAHWANPDFVLSSTSPDGEACRVTETAEPRWDALRTQSIDPSETISHWPDSLEQGFNNAESRFERGVDWAEGQLQRPLDSAAAHSQGVPGLDMVLQGHAAAGRHASHVLGGLAKGAGGLWIGAARMVTHPVATMAHLAELGSHLPGMPFWLARNGYEHVHSLYAAAAKGGDAKAIADSLDLSRILTKDAAYLQSVGTQLASPYRAAIQQGKPGEAVGRGLFEMTGLLAGFGEARTASAAKELPAAATASGTAAASGSSFFAGLLKSARRLYHRVVHPYPPTRQPGPGAIKTAPVPPSPQWQNGANRARVDLRKSHTDPTGIWDQSTLMDPQHRPLKDALDAVTNGKKGQSVAHYDLSGKTGRELHEDLLASGFKHKRQPLSTNKNGQREYGLSKRAANGTWTTLDPRHPDVLPQDLYTHRDGGMVRVKPEGDTASEFRRQPHASKSVLIDPKKGTSLDNEAFKLTNSGRPVPKSVFGPTGMRPKSAIGTKGEYKGYQDLLMEEAHTDLPPPRN